MGVHRTTFDCEDEMVKTSQVYKGAHEEAELIVRISTEDSGAVCQLSNKFGATVPEAKKLLKRAKEMKLRIVGVSFHVGSGQLVPSAYEQAIRDASELFRYGREELDFTGMNLLDIGGGFPGSMSDHDIRLFEEQAAVINESLEKYFGDIGDLEVIAEPGRYFAASAYTLATPIISRKITDSDHHVSYYVSESIYGSFNCLFYDHYILSTPMVLPRDRANSDLSASTIWGSTCDGLDKIMDNACVPFLEPGSDWLIWPDMGAYTLSGSVNFNGLTMGRPLVYYAPSTTWDAIQTAFDDNVSTKFRLVSSTEDLSAANRTVEEEGRIVFVDETALNCAVEFEEPDHDESIRETSCTATSTS
ncbi:hypothetical protein ACOME3_005157 [Neoechinorhynchus agilis]